MQKRRRLEVVTCLTEKDESKDEEQQLNSFFLEIHWQQLENDRKKNCLILFTTIFVTPNLKDQGEEDHIYGCHVYSIIKLIN